jgi:hypothetical protein
MKNTGTSIIEIWFTLIYHVFYASCYLQENSLGLGLREWAIVVHAGLQVSLSRTFHDQTQSRKGLMHLKQLDKVPVAQALHAAYLTRQQATGFVI